MRVLLDACIPIRFADDLPGHEVGTVRGLGWNGVKNGVLLRRTAREFEAFVTVDRALRRQQVIPENLKVILIRTTSNNRRALTPHASAVLALLETAPAGMVSEVGIGPAEAPPSVDSPSPPADNP